MMLPATGLLERAGYRRLEPPPAFHEAQLRMWLLRCKGFAYVHEEKYIDLELHSRLFDNQLLVSKTPPVNSWQTVQLTKESGLCTFGDDDLFAYLCAHGAVHCWFRLKWLADVAALLAPKSTSDIRTTLS